jgi:formylglycine-generating enzyme required for sulfatase activity
VRITKPFYLGVHEVTVGQFRQFIKDTGYKTDAEKGTMVKGAIGWNPDTKMFELNEKYSWQKAGFEQTDDHPVVNVSWNDAVEFCKWLSGKEGKTYRLPTEAEWEYACRAGTGTRYYHGDDPEGLAAVGNVADATAKAQFPEWEATIAARDGYVFTAPVGKFKPNAWGLYDMHGNVWEWCADWHAEQYYKTSPPEDPKGPDSGLFRVLRGGSWDFGPVSSRAANRFPYVPAYRDNFSGFRLARTP